MVDQHWLLNGDAIHSGIDYVTSETPPPELSSVRNEKECELHTALISLKRQISIVNDLLAKHELPDISLEFPSTRHHDENWADKAKTEYRYRRKRDAIFSSFKIFSEPAWDILLDLMIAENQGIRLSTSSVALGSGVPPTTTLRWLSLLEEKGLIYREDDLADGRRSFIRLTGVAVSLMKKVLGERQQIGC